MKAHKVINGLLAAGLVLVTLALYFLIAKHLYQQLYFGKYFLVFSFSLLALLIASLFLRYEHKANLLFALMSSFAALYLTEFALMFLEFPDPLNTDVMRERAAKKHGVAFDKRTNLELIADYEKQGLNYWPNFYPSLVMQQEGLAMRNGQHVLPLSGLSDADTIFCNESGKYVTLRTDELGFNNPKGVHHAAKVDIALIGDSFTHGVCMAQNEDIASLVRKDKNTAIINYGMSSSGPLLEMAIFKEHVLPKKPASVFWLYYEGNDLADLAKENQIAILKRYKTEKDFKQHLDRDKPEIDKAIKKYIQGEKETAAKIEDVSFFNKLLGLVKLRNLRKLTGLNRLKEQPEAFDEKTFSDILEAVRDEIRAYGGNFYFVYLPEWTRYTSKHLQDSEQLHHRQRVLAMVRKLEIPIVDIHTRFRETKDPLALFPFKTFGHYNLQGYQIVAEQISQQAKA